MIKSIELSNFRPHISLKLKNLHPNLNVFIGDTGTGKTSIFRALRLLLENVPQSGVKLYKFIKDKKIGIKANINDILVWRSDKKYTIKKDDGPAINITAFGKKIPKPVKDIINLQDINWQSQIQPPFLVIENGGAIAKILNPIMGSEESDLIINKVKEQVGKLRGDFKLLNSIISDNEKICKQLQNIGKHKKVLEEIQMHIRHLQGSERLIFSISEKLLEIRKIDKIIIHPIKLNSFKKRMKEIESLIENSFELKTNINRMEDKVNKFKNLKHVSVKLYLEAIKEMEDKRTEKIALQGDIDRIESLLKSYEIIDEELENGLEQYSKLKEKWNKEFSKLKICLLCEQEIKNAKDHIHN
jgi:DNA repair exonuclease SbcCD ATPase subunit